MSLAIVVTTNEGNIIAVDSLETYKNAINDVREGSTNRVKLFKLNKRIAIATCGLSFINNKTIYQQIQDFIEQNSLENLSVKSTVEKLHTYFYEKYKIYIQKTAEKHKKQLENLGNKNIEATIILECIKFKYKTPEGNNNSR